MANNNSNNGTDSHKEEFVVQCHCGRVRGRFWCAIDNHNTIIAWDCDCSDCFMRKNTHLIIPERDFSLELPGENTQLGDVTSLYQWGTKTAQRRFCETCGILPWYRPRSNPDGYGITVHCVDWTKGGTRIPPPDICVQPFDGKHWEETIQAMKEGRHEVNITEQPK